MSRSKRVKKYNPRKRVQGIHEEYRHNFWLAGANCLPQVVVGGLLPGQAGVEQMADTYRLKHYWRGYALVFQSNGHQCWVDSLLSEATTPVSAEVFKDYIDEAQDKLLKEANDKFVTCVGYVCTISQFADMDALLNDTIHWLRDHGAFNAEWCNYCLALRPV